MSKIKWISRTESVISSDLPCKDVNAWLTLTSVSDQVWVRFQCVWFFMLFIFICGFSTHFYVYQKQWRNSLFNPISAGVLENQDMLGGGINFDPPSKSHVLCPNMTNDTSLESTCALLLESRKKCANLQKLNFLSQNTVI